MDFLRLRLASLQAALFFLGRRPSELNGPRANVDGYSESIWRGSGVWKSQEELQTKTVSRRSIPSRKMYSNICSSEMLNISVIFLKTFCKYSWNIQFKVLTTQGKESEILIGWLFFGEGCFGYGNPIQVLTPTISHTDRFAFWITT